MKNSVLLVLLLFVSSTVYAGTITITFDPDEYDVKIEKKNKPMCGAIKFQSYSSLQRFPPSPNWIQVPYVLN